jgi:aspartate/methionine/tyrosine aminotransferase
MICVGDSAILVTQYAGIAALEGPQDAVAEMVAAFDRRRVRIVELLNGLPGVSCIDAAGAFYAFPNISGTGMTARAAQDRFLNEAGVATIAGTSFGAQGEGYVRFSYANSIENIEAAIEKIRAVL